MKSQLKHQLNSTVHVRKSLFSTVKDKVELEVSGVVYEAPLTRIAKVLKWTAIASVAGIIGLFPVFFTIESKLPLVARAALFTTTFAMMATSLIAVTWAFKPYVTRIRVLQQRLLTNVGANPIERMAEGVNINITPKSLLLMDTMDFFGRKVTHVTRVESLQKLENVFFRTFKTTSQTTLDSHEAESLRNKEEIGLETKDKVVSSNANDYYFVHLDLGLTSEFERILKIVENKES
ncbi:hypothetical protein AX774_g1903 [Zancudomyces culisetae]|uniref:Transmembrane protein n=1 Tax=Zancudomyces culisetae TaxID=1213189 RepID=A0A1R1PCI1_ZANCU|nr:hypothetical protein AX774_g7932 [Zancudomyces culisetae]OMH84574.1 hypothetical protein AX774_g1903 [Zancudomyces culisetae]|eukprot:OMH78674.1 hypothetical protein AX774_g7932 [Zancudomyces culisetae]